MMKAMLVVLLAVLAIAGAMPTQAASGRRLLGQGSARFMRNRLLMRQYEAQPKVDAATRWRRMRESRERRERKKYDDERSAIKGHHNKEFHDLLNSGRTRNVNSRYLARPRARLD